MSDTSWRAQAACRGLDPNFFFKPSNLHEIRKRCVDCPVFDQCFEWCTDPITIDEVPFGIVAGYTADQRFKIAGQRYVGRWREVYQWRPKYRDKNGKLRTSRNVTTPIGEVRAAPHKGTLQLQERAAARPQCPECHTGIDVQRYRKNAAGQQVWVHLPCKTKILEAE